jgi:hypothetical protein
MEPEADDDVGIILISTLPTSIPTSTPSIARLRGSAH